MNRLRLAARSMIRAHDAWIDWVVVEPVAREKDWHLQAGLPDWAVWRAEEVERLKAIDRGLRYLNVVLRDHGQEPVTVHDFRPRCQQILHEAVSA